MLIKKIVALAVTVVALALLLASCSSVDLFKSDMEAMMDDVLVADNYTMVYKDRSDIYTTVKVCDGEMYVLVDSGKNLEEYYLYCNEDTGEYFIAHEWKHSETDKGIEKEKVSYEEYLEAYMEISVIHSQVQKVFNYRRVLDMMESKSDVLYEYSNGVNSAKEYYKNEYTIKLKEDTDELEILETYTIGMPDPENEDGNNDGIILRSTTAKTTYSKIGETSFTIPTKIINK